MSWHSVHEGRFIRLCGFGVWRVHTYLIFCCIFLFLLFID